MGEQARKLRALLDSREHFVVADCYSALTGRIVEHVGFKAAYAGGHACGAFHYAVPDCGVYSQAEHIEQSARIASAMNIPLIADADTLGDTIAEAYHFTRRYEQAGIAGIHVEDEVNPRHSRFKNGLLPIVDMQARIEACTKARSDPAFVIIARCDEFYLRFHLGIREGSIEDAIKRGRAYAEAGADALLYPVASPEEHEILVRALPIPICVIGPTLPGAAFTLNAGWGWLGAAQLHLQRARTLFETGSISVNADLEGKTTLLDQDLFDEIIGDWARKTGRPLW
jgi:2-methylisocitrate lyase-like PEP mutase family enzyme